MTARHTVALLVAAVAFPMVASAQEPLQAAPSGRGTSEVSLSPANAPPGTAVPPSVIRLDFGQPHLRGRTLLTDSLVPYDQPWRLGANAATTLTTDVDLMIGTAQVGKGTWVLEAIPGRTSWILLIKQVTGTGPMGQTISEEVARTELRLRPLSTPIESLTMWLIPARGSGPARGELRFAWGAVELRTDWAVR